VQLLDVLVVALEQVGRRHGRLLRPVKLERQRVVVVTLKTTKESKFIVKFN
jgi:hypothetical protein